MSQPISSHEPGAHRSGATPLDPHGPDAFELYAQALSLPASEARIAALERAELAAERANEMALLTEIRLVLTSASAFGRHPMRILRPITWLTRQVQAGAPWLTEQQVLRTLWQLKWVANELVRSPDVPRAHVDAFLAMMRDVYAGQRQGMQPVLAVTYAALSQLDGELAATQAHDQWVRAPRTQLSDCQACEDHLRVERLVALGDDAGAVRAAATLLDGDATCAEQPQFAQALMVLPLVRCSEFDRARTAAREAWQRVRDDDAGFIPVGQLIEAMALTGNLDAAVEMWSLRSPQLVDPPTPWAAMFFAARGARLCRALIDAGRGDMLLRVPEGEWVEASILAPRLAGSARTMAQRFDQRNANPHVGQQIEAILWSPALPPVDLPTTGTRPASDPELQVPTESRWALAPTADDLAGMDAEAVAAIAEDAVRFGSTDEFQRVLRRWLDLDWSGLDPRVRATTCDLLWGSVATWEESLRLLQASEDAWREVGEEQRANAAAVRRLGAAGEEVECQALAEVVFARGDAESRALALLAVAELAAQPPREHHHDHGLPDGLPDDQAELVRLDEERLADERRAHIVTRMRQLADELDTDTAGRRRVRALLLASVLALVPDANDVDITEADLGLVEDEFVHIPLSMELMRLGDRLEAGFAPDELADFHEACRRCIERARSHGVITAWARAMVLEGRAAVAGDDVERAEACWRAASQPEVQRVAPLVTMTVLHVLSQLLAATGREAAAADAAGRALVIADRPPQQPADRMWHDVVGLNLMQGIGILERSLGHLERSAMMLRRSLDRARQLDHPVDVMDAQHELALTLAEMDATLEARTVLSEACDAALADRRPEGFAWLLDLARVTHATDGLDASLAVLDRAELLLGDDTLRDGHKSLDPERARAALVDTRARLCATSGQYQRALDLVRGLADEVDRLDQPDEALRMRIFEARMQLMLADPADAGAGDRLLELARVAQEHDEPDMVLTAAGHVIDWHWNNGREKLAEELAEQFGLA